MNHLDLLQPGLTLVYVALAMGFGIVLGENLSKPRALSPGDATLATLAQRALVSAAPEPTEPSRAPLGSASVAITVEQTYQPLPENLDLYRRVRTVRVTVDHQGVKQDFTGPDLVVPFSAAEAFLRAKMGL